MPDKNHKFQKSEKGFTLLEIALVLMISGMFVAAAAQFLKLYTKTAQYETTVDNAEIIQEVLFEYYVREGHYPCPADPRLPPTDVNYGVEACRVFTTQAAYEADKNNCNAPPPQPPLFGCPDPATSNARDVDGDGVASIVLIGALPFRTLSQYLDALDGDLNTTAFREVHKKDGYGELFTYAVTESMTGTNPENTTITPARPFDGAIPVEDENGISLTEPYGAAHYVLLSHGDNGRGGYTDQGSRVADCIILDLTDPLNPVPAPSPPPGPDPGLGGGLDLELENCNFENAIFLKGIRSTAINSSYYDDLVFFKVSESAPIWQVSLSSQDNETYIYNTNEGSAGIGTTNIAPSMKLHVAGNVLGEGAVVASEYCDGTSSTCLHPDSLGGSGSTCPEGQAAYGISNGALACVEVPWTIPTVSCPLIGGAQTYMHAISNLGRITCCFEDGSGCQDYQ